MNNNSELSSDDLNGEQQQQPEQQADTELNRDDLAKEQDGDDFQSQINKLVANNEKLLTQKQNQNERHAEELTAVRSEVDSFKAETSALFSSIAGDRMVELVRPVNGSADFISYELSKAYTVDSSGNKPVLKDKNGNEITSLVDFVNQWRSENATKFGNHLQGADSSGGLFGNSSPMKTGFTHGDNRKLEDPQPLKKF